MAGKPHNGRTSVGHASRFGEIFESVSTVPGWLSRVDALLFCLLADWQDAEGMSGDVLEIGAYHGQSAIVLGHLLGPGDRLDVCDVFGSRDLPANNLAENDADYPGYTYDDFARHYLAVHDQLPVIHNTPSSRVDGELSGREFRLIHIDGSHQLSDVRGDIALAQRHTAENGVIALDDWSHSDHPEVAAAVWEATLAHTLHPFAITDMKLYALLPGPYTEEVASALRSYLAAHPELRSWNHNLDPYTVLQLRLGGWTREESRRV